MGNIELGKPRRFDVEFEGETITGHVERAAAPARINFNQEVERARANGDGVSLITNSYDEIDAHLVSINVTFFGKELPPKGDEHRREWVDQLPSEVVNAIVRCRMGLPSERPSEGNGA